MKFGIWIFFENLLINFKFYQYLTWILGTLYEDVCTFTTVFRLVLLRVINVSCKVLQKIKTHILYAITFFPENRAIYEVIWKNFLEPTGRR